MASNVRKLHGSNDIPAVERTSKGLRDALFDELEGLRLGIYTPGHVTAASSIAHAIVRVMRLELDYTQRLAEQPALEDHKPVPLGTVTDA